MSRGEGKQLRDRWSGVSTAGLRAQLLAPVKSPFGRTKEGLWDLRGILVEDVLHRLVLEQIDFSFSEMMALGQLGGGTTVVACKFDFCRYETTIQAIFENCSFIGSNLHRSIVGQRFVGCVFERARLSGVRGSGVRFEECVFAQADFRSASFYDSVFAHCRFDRCRFGNGSLAGSKFQDCVFSQTDLVNTLLERVTGL